MPRLWRTLLPGQRSEVRVHSLVDGSDVVVYASAEKLVEAPNWSPGFGATASFGAEWLCLNYEGSLYRLQLAPGADVELLPGQPSAGFNNDHVIAPSGQAVFGSGEDKHLYEVSLTGAPWRRVTTSDDGLTARYLHGISPDGSLLSFVAFHGQPQQLDVFTVPAAGGEVTQLTDSLQPHDGPEFSPDGKYVYYNAVPEGAAEGHSQIFRMHLDGSNVTQLTHDERVNWFPHVSPDNEWILYLSYPPGTLGHPANLPVELRLMRRETHEVTIVRELFGGQGTINVASWAPDSQRFAYVAYPCAPVTAAKLD